MHVVEVWRRTRVCGVALAATALNTGALMAHPIVPGFERFHRPLEAGAAAVDGGLLLINELNCVACHQVPDTWRERLPGRGPISLAGVGGRMEVTGLRALVGDPHGMKPGTTMPAVVSDDPPAADAIAAFLSSLQERPAVASPLPDTDAARGGTLFNSIGCAACHAPLGGNAAHGKVPIGLATHYGERALAEFLRNPLHTRPGGRMPAFPLSDAEAADLAAYLKQSDKGPAPARSVEPALAEKGRQLFVGRNCVACHDAGTERTRRAAMPLANLRAGQGCLAEWPLAAAPDFALDARQREALELAVRAVQSGPPEVLTAGQRVTETLMRLNCYACHEWRGRGGVDAELAKQLAASGVVESLGEAGYLPPKLDATGRKLTATWLEKLLWGEGGGVRPYLSLRMPRYGEANAATLVPAFAEACRPATPQEIDTSGTKGHQRSATGRTLMGAGQDGLGCVACHGLKEREAAGVRSINLTHTVQRVRPEYFKALLLDPQGVQPGTIMPPLLAGRKNEDREIESLWTYLKELDQNPRLPEGLEAAGSFELKPEVEGRPIVFRTFLEGAGLHAIAVGYPARVHVAFDALEVRWALAWRGRYLDALSNWEERAMPPVKPLGEARMLPAHLPLARLRTPDEAWPETWGVAAGYSFRGYRMESDGTPVFRYAVNGLEVEDSLRPGPDGSLRRTLEVRGTGDDWYFRGVDADSIPLRVAWRDGVATFEEIIRF